MLILLAALMNHSPGDANLPKNIRNLGAEGGCKGVYILMEPACLTLAAEATTFTHPAPMVPSLPTLPQKPELIGAKPTLRGFQITPIIDVETEAQSGEDQRLRPPAFQ